jgi:hypothetical protein
MVRALKVRLTVDLSPAHVVSQIKVARITHRASVKGWQGRREWLVRKVLGPEKDIIARKGGRDRRGQLAKNSLALCLTVTCRGLHE